MSNKQEALQALSTFGVALTAVGGAIFERLDEIAASQKRILAILEGQQILAGAPEDPPSVPPPTPRKEVRDTRASAPRSAIKIRKLDPYHTILGAKIVRLLLREEVRPVGKVTKSISSEIELSESATKRLIGVLHDALPFLMLSKSGGGALLRVRGDHVQEAQDWLDKAETVSMERQDFGSYRCSQLAFDTYAPKVIHAILSADPEQGMLSNEIYEATGVNAGMFRGVMNRLLPEGFIKASVGARGHASTVTITDPERARKYLGKFPGYGTQPINGVSRLHPHALARRRARLAGALGSGLDWGSGRCLAARASISCRCSWTRTLEAMRIPSGLSSPFVHIKATCRISGPWLPANISRIPTSKPSTAIRLTYRDMAMGFFPISCLGEYTDCHECKSHFKQ